MVMQLLAKNCKFFIVSIGFKFFSYRIHGSIYFRTKKTMVLTRTFETDHKKIQKKTKTQNIKIEVFKVRISTRSVPGIQSLCLRCQGAGLSPFALFLIDITVREHQIADLNVPLNDSI